MAYTQADLDSIQKTLASGLMTCKLNGREVTFRSQEALLQMKSIIEEELTPSNQKPPKFVTLQYDSGYQ